MYVDCPYSSTVKTNIKNNEQLKPDMIDFPPVNQLIMKIAVTQPAP